MINMDIIEKINNFPWADVSFDEVKIDYERVSISLSYDEKNIKIYCNNFIGFSFIGHWDENIIESIIIESKGDLINESIKKVNRFYGSSPVLPGGRIKSFDKIWYQLNVKLIDGNAVEIVCESFDFEMFMNMQNENAEAEECEDQGFSGHL